MKRVVLDQRERFGLWALERIGHAETWGEWYEAIGLEEDGEEIAACVFNLYSAADVSMHIAAVPGRRWMTRDFLWACFRYPFVQLGVRRVTGLVPASNADALRFDLHLGFKVEGRLREATEEGEDIIVLGMLRRECRFID